MDEFRALLASRTQERGARARLADASGISPNVISRWLHPTKPTNPQPANLKRLAPALGVPYPELMRMCGYLPGEPQSAVDTQREIIRAQLDRWLDAVGPDYESYFWAHLKAQGDSSAALIRDVTTAINTVAPAAVSAPALPAAKRGRRPRDHGNSSLTPVYAHLPAGSALLRHDLAATPGWPPALNALVREHAGRRLATASAL